jgi:CHAT domain-containing protein
VYEERLAVKDLATSTYQARVAYLSACSMAEVRVGSLSDENIHLAGVFQLTGFPNVIGSLWPVDDRAAAQLAGAFYRILPRQA